MTHNFNQRCPTCERLQCICIVHNNRKYKSNYEFQPGDGTNYLIHLVPAKYGGLYVIVNETSMWRYHRNDTLKFLNGNGLNKWTQTAVFNFLEAVE